METRESSQLITVHIKTPKNKEAVQTAPDATVKQFKELVSQKFNAQPDKICLIFSGKILKDEETLDKLDIKDGLTVHLVIKNNKEPTQQPKQSEQSPSATPTTSTQAPPPLAQGGLPGLAGLSSLSTQNPQVLEQAQQHLLQNPELMSQLMNSPAVQGLMSNPDIFREFFLNNSQMQGVLERNPEIGHVLNNPQLMRQAMEIARNPALMQEMMRNQDVALRNIESLPGGYSALRRLYSEVQEPMISAAQETFQPAGQEAANPFAGLFPSTTQSQPAQTRPVNTGVGSETTNPLPNPWAPPTSTTSQPPTSTATSAAGQQSLQGLFQSPGLQHLMRQMQENPQLLQNAMQMPQMQEMMHQFSTNPELMNLLITSNPLLANDQNLANQIRGQLPLIMNQMQNPEFQAAMTNPEVLSAMMQIQQGMQRLTNAAPGLLPGMGINTGAANVRPPAPNTQNSAYNMQNLMSQMVSSLNAPGAGVGATGGAAPGTRPPNPEVAFQAQLQQLTQMGFVDAHANLQALISTNGDLNSAIERLLQQRDQLT